MVSRGASPTRLRLLDRTWEPSDGPVLALFEVHGSGARAEGRLSSAELYHGIVDGTAGPVIVRMPPLIDRQFDHWMTAIAGKSLVFERVRDRTDEHGNLIARGLYRFDLDTSAWTRLPVDPGPIPRRWFTVTASPDGSRVVVVTHRQDEVVAKDKPLHASITTTVWEVTDGTARQVTAMRGMWREGDIPDRAAQLSPDGTRLALAISEAGTWSARLVVLDMATGERVNQAGAIPWGSAAWSPDGHRMLVLTSAGLEMLDLNTNETVPLPVAPNHTDEPGNGRAFPAGFLDDTHLLIYSERHNYNRDTTTLTISSVPVDGTDRTPLYTWTAPSPNQYIRPQFPTPIPERFRATAGLDAPER